MQEIQGFSKFNKTQKIDWLQSQFSDEDQNEFLHLKNFWVKDALLQKTFDDFSENTISNFNIPYGIAPNFKINEKNYCIPMVTEESSVVAAAAKSAKYWFRRGGFKTKVLGTVKVGHIHFTYTGDVQCIKSLLSKFRDQILSENSKITENMNKRGGGILDINLIDCTNKLKDYFQIELKFETCDAMGANFINSVLEQTAESFLRIYREQNLPLNDIEIIMSILSNYTPECLVECTVECPIEELGEISGFSAESFANKFKLAVDIAIADVSRAVTHNKGILNGVDSVVLATGNDFRAIESCAHAYAAKSGSYRSLSEVSLNNNTFQLKLKLPIAIGTIGGLTNLHPLAKLSLTLLGNPSAKELMEVIAAVGLAQNFAAIKSLITTGIQKGHMKMHLLNILNQLEATENEMKNAKEFFEKRVVSYTAVRSFIQSIRVVH